MIGNENDPNSELKRQRIDLTLSWEKQQFPSFSASLRRRRPCASYSGNTSAEVDRYVSRRSSGSGSARRGGEDETAAPFTLPPTRLPLLFPAVTFSSTSGAMVPCSTHFSNNKRCSSTRACSSCTTASAASNESTEKTLMGSHTRLTLSRRRCCCIAPLVFALLSICCVLSMLFIDSRSCRARGGGTPADASRCASSARQRSRASMCSVRKISDSLSGMSDCNVCWISLHSRWKVAPSTMNCAGPTCSTAFMEKEEYKSNRGEKKEREKKKSGVFACIARQRVRFTLFSKKKKYTYICYIDWS